jgi:hypothetical protein
MLTLTIQPKGDAQKDDLQPFTAQWKTGTNNPVSAIAERLGLTHSEWDSFSSYVTKLAANETELMLIRAEFSGIPMHSGSHIVWEGETARFIAAHLF